MGVNLFFKIVQLFLRLMNLWAIHETQRQWRGKRVLQDKGFWWSLEGQYSFSFCLKFMDAPSLTSHAHMKKYPYQLLKNEFHGQLQVERNKNSTYYGALTSSNSSQKQFLCKRGFLNSSEKFNFSHQFSKLHISRWEGD